MTGEVTCLGALIILTTTPTLEDAKKISRGLVENKLVACVSILNSVESVFLWEGKLSDERECLLVVKTTEKLFGKVRDWIKKHHPYSVPEILGVKVDFGSSDYLKWVNETTR